MDCYSTIVNHMLLCQDVAWKQVSKFKFRKYNKFCLEKSILHMFSTTKIQIYKILKIFSKNSSFFYFLFQFFVKSKHENSESVEYMEYIIEQWGQPD